MSLLLLPTADFTLTVPRKGSGDTENKIERKGQRRGPSVKRAKTIEKLPIRNKQETRTPAPKH